MQNCMDDLVERVGRDEFLMNQKSSVVHTEMTSSILVTHGKSIWNILNYPGIGLEMQA